jgi:membrane associated rhomboid family serine protease
VPARYAAIGSQFAFPGGAAGEIWSFLTYAFLHADWMHVIINLVWMVAFGAIVARRLGTGRFLALSVATAVGGAAMHLVSNWGQMIPMIGASAVVSGYMGAALRFAFATPGMPVGIPPRYDPRLTMPAMPLAEVLRDKRVIAFIVVWFGINLLFGVGVAALPGQAGAIAWQAHVGGFLVGLLGFPLFDPVSRRSRGDAPPPQEWSEGP